ncbi:MAG: Sec-C motif domain protein [Flavobacteriaceae bacterium]|nr:MAG: Sec-C motif domain protein [Flavobacteriaceae bacterium]
MTTCNCGSEQNYEACCKLVHIDIHNAKTAEMLMRSRYSAFCKADGDYLIKSQAKKHAPSSTEIKEIVSWAKSVTWVKLEVIASTHGQANDHTGTVTFKASYFDADGMGIIEEKSLFEKENGHWVYVTGIE